MVAAAALSTMEAETTTMSREIETEGSLGGGSTPTIEESMLLSTSTLPQPTSSKSTATTRPKTKMTTTYDKYRYIRCDEIPSVFFPPQRPLMDEQLCWVLLTKKGFFKRARVVHDNLNDDDNDFNAIGSDNDDSENPEAATGTGTGTESKKDRRILVRYPKGSTYRVRRTNLLPVLEDFRQYSTPAASGVRKAVVDEDALVIVASETTDYRRVTITHTLDSDHFVEIGCDFGILCDSVHCQTSLGIDKSESSIAIARVRYPSRTFLLGDIFEEFDTMMSSSSSFFQQPLVVAIDINGNRALPAVIDCIQLVMDKIKPRLIVVKSRELYSVMQ